jgi:hypothetical protein
MFDTEELVAAIRHRIDYVDGKLWRTVELLDDAALQFDNGEADLGACESEIRLSLELARELTISVAASLRNADRACARMLGEDDDDVNVID